MSQVLVAHKTVFSSDDIFVSLQNKKKQNETKKQTNKQTNKKQNLCIRKSFQISLKCEPLS